MEGKGMEGREGREGNEGREWKGMEGMTMGMTRGSTGLLSKWQLRKIPRNMHIYIIGLPKFGFIFPGNGNDKRKHRFAFKMADG